MRNRVYPNTRVLGLTCREERIIGFDMLTPPLDRNVRDFRGMLAAASLEQINEELVKVIHAFAVSRNYELVTVDHHWASFPMLRMIFAQRRIKAHMRRGGLDQARLWVIERIDRLRGLLDRSPLFEKKPLDADNKLERYGVTVFKVVYSEEASAP